MMAWESGGEEYSISSGAEDLGSWGGQSGNLAFLDRWKDDGDVAKSLLHQHSSWLKTFREQIGKVGGNVAASAQVPSGVLNNLMQQHSMQSMGSSRAVGGKLGAGGMPLGGGAGASGSGSGYPLKVDIGNNQEIVIAVRHK